MHTYPKHDACEAMHGGAQSLCSIIFIDLSFNLLDQPNHKCTKRCMSQNAVGYYMQSAQHIKH